MAPPKVKLHKSTGKQKYVPRPNSSGSSLQSPTGNVPNAAASDTSPATEADRQFELELYWCIQQLETSLSLPHVRENNKKIEDTTKLITTLKSANQPIIRKRQIMRTTFGDYRSKMAAEEESLAVNPDSVRFQREKAKYHFVKKSSILNGNKDFRFNFPLANGNGGESADVANHTEKQEKETETANHPTHNCKYVPTDNTFRFNFSPAIE
ncbi:UPF0488 protein CG14286 [Anopheles ziemanni]|uniref:UPF0488 protein CG14286 n=1 Tax=Anopheles coustani TaxID=139045 RepID=UPI00265AAB22|nr:UPF0488 protein CG14286 [Anopheles coustani]XP_058173295.1 UPF0488 protein CG14286 [Anopheles ziemanni]